jgi:tetratricopeptide (TPR) repeat protein
MNLEKIKERLKEIEASIDQFEREVEIYRSLNIEGLNHWINIANSYIEKGNSEEVEQNFKLAIKHYSKAQQYINMIHNFHELYRSGLTDPKYFEKGGITGIMLVISCIIMICITVVLFILTDFVYGFPLPLNPVSISLLVILLVSSIMVIVSYVIGQVYDRKLTKKRKDIPNN